MGPRVTYTDDHPRTVEMVGLWDDGVSIDDIAAHFGVSRRCVEQFTMRHRHLFKKRLNKATKEEEAKIWEMYGNGFSIYAISKALKRSAGLVNRVLREE